MAASRRIASRRCRAANQQLFGVSRHAERGIGAAYFGRLLPLPPPDLKGSYRFPLTNSGHGSYHQSSPYTGPHRSCPEWPLSGKSCQCVPREWQTKFVLDLPPRPLRRSPVLFIWIALLAPPLLPLIHVVIGLLSRRAAPPWRLSLTPVHPRRAMLAKL